MKKRLRKTKTANHCMVGGPLHGRILRLATAGTLPFTLNGQTGHYDSNNVWVEHTKKDN